VASDARPAAGGALAHMRSTCDLHLHWRATTVSGMYVFAS
jgi:hypothetical protein